MNPPQMYDLVLLALCNWREARGESLDAKLAQAWTVRNRAMNPSWWGGPSYASVILKPYQFSSFNHNDPNASKMPTEEDSSWTECLTIANEVYSGTGTDLTSGCSHYFDKSLDSHPPSWAAEMVHVIDIGNLRFYRKA
jgi:N-acetylmuramoyl-L-alanine amidase